MQMETRERLQQAMLAGDHAGVVALYAPDIRLNSPLIKTPFEGRGAVADLTRAILDAFEDIHYTASMGSGEQQMVAFEARVRGERVQGVDMLRVGGDGLIQEITVYIRPLAAQARVAQALGVPLARLRGRWQAWVLGILGRPLPLMFGGLDVLAPRLTQLRKR
jgi:hypothetical protein